MLGVRPSDPADRLNWGGIFAVCCLRRGLCLRVYNNWNEFLFCVFVVFVCHRRVRPAENQL